MLRTNRQVMTSCDNVTATVALATSRIDTALVNIDRLKQVIIATKAVNAQGTPTDQQREPMPIQALQVLAHDAMVELNTAFKLLQTIYDSCEYGQ